MCWTCDRPDASVQDYLDSLRTKMLKNGWAVQYIESDRTPFAYTIGLHDWGLPELLVSRQKFGHQLLQPGVFPFQVLDNLHSDCGGVEFHQIPQAFCSSG